MLVDISEVTEWLLGGVMDASKQPESEFESANDSTICMSLAESDLIQPWLKSAAEISVQCAQLEQVDKHESLFSTPFIEHSLIVFYKSSCHQNCRMIHVSSAIANFGFSQQLWLDKTNFRLTQVHEDDFDRVCMALQHSINTGERFNCLYRFYDSRKNIHWIHDEASVEFDSKGMPAFLKGIMLDITDKKSLEIELNEHRYYIENKVAQKTEQLMKKIELLESCNATLCKKLEVTQTTLANLIQLEVAAQPDLAI